jgi:hypothetical protein
VEKIKREADDPRRMSSEERELETRESMFLKPNAAAVRVPLLSEPRAPPSVVEYTADLDESIQVQSRVSFLPSSSRKSRYQPTMTDQTPSGILDQENAIDLEPHPEDHLEHAHGDHAVHCMPSLSQGTMSVGKHRPRLRKILMESALEIVLLLGNIMVQRGIWNALDDSEVPAAVSGLFGLVSFVLSILLNTCLNTAKEESRIFTPRRYFMSALLLLCSVNVWRSLWNLQDELRIPLSTSTAVGTVVIIIGMMMEQCLARRRARELEAAHDHAASLAGQDVGHAVVDGFSHGEATRNSMDHASLPHPEESPPADELNPVADLICKIRNR